MSPPRVDLFTVFHKALRQMMYNTGSLLARTDFSNSEEKAEAIAELTRTLSFFDEHLRLEGNFVAPLMQEAAPELVNELGSQHNDQRKVTKAIIETMQGLAKSDGASAVALGALLFQAFNEMIAEQTLHMNYEEVTANAALWDTHDDSVLGQARAAIQSSIPTARFTQWLGFALPSSNPQELVGLFSGVKLRASPALYSQMSREAAKLLGDRWPPIEKALEE